MWLTVRCHRHGEPNDGDPVEQVRSLTDGHGVDHALEVIELVPTLKQATKMLDHHGAAYVIGRQKPKATLAVNVNPMGRKSLLRKEQTVRGVNMGTTTAQIDIPL